MTKPFSYLLLLSTLLFMNCRNHGGKVSSQSGISSSGSCEISPEIIIPYLPVQLIETSGLEIFNGEFWTINDSGGEASILRFDGNTGEVRQVIEIRNAINHDWESLASDDYYLFIGDFGNNRGNRQNLRIYKVRKSDIPLEGDAVVESEIILYSYPDQEQFQFGMNNNSFDCEAFVCMNDTLYLFSKDWVTETTKVYSVPAVAGEYIAELIDSFSVDGLITGADISCDKSKLVLLGYRDYFPFFWIHTGIREGEFFSGKSTRINMCDMYRAQTEAIVFSSNDTLYISSEQSETPSRLYRVVLNE